MEATAATTALTESMTVEPVGVVHSSFTDAQTGREKRDFSRQEATIAVFPRFAEGLRGMDTLLGTTLVVCYRFHKTCDDPCSLTVRPHHDPARQQRGVFATNSNRRPNSIGLCCVTLLAVDYAAATLTVRGLDAVDGTPVLDIKLHACCALHAAPQAATD